MQAHRSASDGQPSRGSVLTVTPNPAWDVTYPVPKMRWGESIRVSSPTARAGGKGVNVARVVCQLGGRALVVAPVGGWRGQAFADSLAADGMPSRLVPVSVELRQSVAVVPDSDGPQGSEPTLFNEAGEALHTSSWDALIEAVEESVAETRPQAVVISGSMPPGTTEAHLAALLNASRGAGAAVLADTSGQPLVWAARAGADLVKPNRTEAMTATGAKDLGTAADELRRLGAGSVIVTDGSEGMVAYAGPRIWRARSRKVVSGNPTGAGDAALAALALTWGESWPHRLQNAVAASAASVADPVAGRVDPRLVAELRESLDVKEIS